MWQNIVNIVQSTGAFLSNGKAPPNTPARLQQEMEDTNHLASKKFFIVFTASLLLAFFYFSSVLVLFFLPHLPDMVTGFVTMFTKTIEVLAVIIAFYTTGQAVVDLKYNSESNAGLEGRTMTENINEHIIEQGSDNAPEIKPYSTIATEE